MKYELKASQFRYEPGKTPSVNQIATQIDDFYGSNGDYKDMLESRAEEIAELQNIMYAHDKVAFLLIFQGMDTAGKDGAIKHVLAGVNPSGVSVTSFKRPSELELEHDWIWRSQSHMPERGRLAVFNRSYYEEVLVVKVNPFIVQKVQRIPPHLTEDLDKLWQQRYSDIRNYEDYLYRNGTHVIKFFFHLGRDEQKKRLMERINEPEKNWKMSIQDVKERQRWPQYMDAYDALLKETHTKDNPWYIIPADDKKNARLIVAQILLEHLQGLKVEYPKVSAEFLEEMQEAKRMLEAEKD